MIIRKNHKKIDGKTGEITYASRIYIKDKQVELITPKNLRKTIEFQNEIIFQSQTNNKKSKLLSFKKGDDKKLDSLPNVERDIKKEINEKYKNRKPISESKAKKLHDLGYPKFRPEPSDRIKSSGGEVKYRFSIDKTLKRYKLDKIRPILPIDMIKDLTDRDFFAKIAQKQYEKNEVYNNLPIDIQRKTDLKKRTQKIVGLSIVPLFIAGSILMSSIPNYTYNSSVADFNNQKYEEAYKSFTALGNFKDAPYLAKFSEGVILLNKGQYDEAKTALESVKPYQEKIGVTNIDEYISEATYRKAEILYNSSQTIEAVSLLNSIKGYKDANEKMTQYATKTSTEYEKERNYDKALAVLNAAGVNDAITKRKNEIMESVYLTAKADYLNKRYDQAHKNYKYLAPLKYKDADLMQNQAIYQKGLNQYLQKNYAEAIESLEPVVEFKDAAAIIKESRYILSSQKAPAERVILYNSLFGYKDTELLSIAPDLILYGSWIVNDINGNKTENTLLVFNKANELTTSKSIPALATKSAEGTGGTYQWVNGKYIDVSTNTEITIEIINSNILKLVSNQGEDSTRLTIQRNETLFDLEVANNTHSNISKVLNEYIVLKANGKITLNGKEEILIEDPLPEEENTEP